MMTRLTRGTVVLLAGVLLAMSGGCGGGDDGAGDVAGVDGLDGLDGVDGGDGWTEEDAESAEDVELVDETSTEATGPVCGASGCEAGEDCASCPADCGACPPVCGDGACLPGESCSSCAADCAICMASGSADPSCTGDGGSGGPTCGGLSDAWTAGAVNVGYYPFQAVRTTNMYSGDPGGGGTVVETLAPGQGVGLQTTRNPNCLDNPPLRPAVAGWAFGFRRGADGARPSGWVALADLTFVGYDGGPCATGPAFADFEAAHNPYDGCRALVCDGTTSCAAVNPAGEGDNDCGGTRVDQSRTVDADTLYVRYSPGGTATHYLHRGDTVHVMYRTDRHGTGTWWNFIEVTGSSCPTLTPVGTRGWTQEAYLR
jgi:hypothetical protein